MPLLSAQLMMKNSSTNGMQYANAIKKRKFYKYLLPRIQDNDHKLSNTIKGFLFFNFNKPLIAYILRI